MSLTLIFRYGDASSSGIAPFASSHCHYFCYSVKLVRFSPFVITTTSWLIKKIKAVNWAIIVLAAVLHLNPSPSQAKTLNRLTGTISFLTLGTTLVTTALISYRIHSVVNQDLSRGARTRFKNILEILIQSAALYVVVTLASAIVAVVSYPANNFLPLLGAQDYIDTFFIFTAVCACYLLSKSHINPSPSTRDFHRQLWSRGSHIAVVKK